MPSPLVLTVVVLALAIGGLLGWLQFSYEAPETTPGPPGGVVVEVAPAAKTEAETATKLPPAETARAIEAAVTTKPGAPPPEAAAEPATPSPPAAPARRWSRHAQPFQDTLGRPRIAIVIWGLGLSRADTTAAIGRLPGEVTLAFAPYGRNLQEWADKARAAGHEIVLQVPMEPYGYPKNDPGPHTLLTSLSSEENVERLDWLLRRFEGYVGITNQLGARFTRSAENLGPVLRAVRSRDLIFLDSGRGGDGLAYEVAGVLGLDRVVNDRFIDDEVNRQAIDAELAALEAKARERGSAVGIGFPYPLTVERLLLWIERLGARGIVLAPLSAVHVSGKTG